MPKSESNEVAVPSLLTNATLRAWPLPLIHGDCDKDERGSVLVVGGSASTPGAVLLAGIGALRVGAGKLRIATAQSTAVALAVAVPEALVDGLPEVDGHLSPAGVERVLAAAAHARAVCLGPGLLSGEATNALAQALLPRLRVPVVLDAAALDVLRVHPTLLHALEGRAVLTPHAGEAGRMLGMDRAAVTAGAPEVAQRLARHLRAVVALKGGETFVAAPDGTTLRYVSGDAGLATSGSGDVLAGIVAGLLARGATAAQAAAWGVCLHGDAGNVLARARGRVGYLARELLDEVPSLLRALDEEPLTTSR